MTKREYRLADLTRTIAAEVASAHRNGAKCPEGPLFSSLCCSRLDYEIAVSALLITGKFKRSFDNLEIV